MGSVDRISSGGKSVKAGGGFREGDMFFGGGEKTLSSGRLLGVVAHEGSVLLKSVVDTSLGIVGMTTEGTKGVELSTFRGEESRVGQSVFGAV